MQKIVKDVLSGQRGAATRLYKEYAPRIAKFLRVKLATEQEVEELLQDTFISILDSLPLYREDSSLLTWMMSIARHEVADYYRKRYVRAAIEKTAPLFESIMADIQTPEFELRKKKIRAKFMKAYHSLSAAHRDVLSYRYELGMSVKEVAEKMEISVKAAESQLYRARVAFREAYEA